MCVHMTEKEITMFCVKEEKSIGESERLRPKERERKNSVGGRVV